MKTAFLATAAAFAMASPSFAAVTIDFDEAGTVPNDLVVFESGAGASDGQSIGVNAFAFTDSRDGIAARPAFGSTGAFGAVLGSPTAGSFTTFLPQAARFFGFTLGSLDSYNSLTLRFEDGTTQLFEGGQITGGGLANGNQVIGATNGFVTFRSDGAKIVSADFTSTSNSFEFDNLASGAVPEPATWAMMILGFGVIGSAVRRRRSVTARLRLA